MGAVIDAIPRRVVHILFGSAVLALAACVTATPYRAADEDGFGYQTQKIESNRYRVSFSGNAYTDKETVRNYLLYRAAELTLEQNGDYFIIANQDTERDIRQTTAGVGAFGYPFVYGFGFGGTTTTSTLSKYEAFGVITIHEGQKPANNPMAYDASEVESNLQELIKLPE